MQSERIKLALGAYTDAVNAAIAEAERSDVIRRIWSKDASLWKVDEAQQKIIRNSLGWLTVASDMQSAIDDLQQFANDIRRSGFTHVLLCGMGGSSLCPEVLTRTFGQQAGFPKLLVLDSTDPDFIDDLRQELDVAKSLFVIASKSGTTTEPIVFYKYWYDQVTRVKDNPGESFVLITDPGSPMIEDARDKKFRRVFLNQPDIGGRYSALSYFGMVPAALMGLDVAQLLGRATTMAQLCGPEHPFGENPAAMLGIVMGECARSGRDKLTIVTDLNVPTVGLWIEQLVAESTGKEGKGILPVNAEPLGPPEEYGKDRVFVCVSVGDVPGAIEEQLEELSAAGHPIVYSRLTEKYDLAAEFFLWEFATACAGWKLRINPFDQPNVQESKDATKRVLETFKAQGELPKQSPLLTDHFLTFYAPESMRGRLTSDSSRNLLQSFVSLAQPGDYFALLAYIEETAAIEIALQSIRTHLRDTTRCATTTGYGPRFLHSTGQLHKGGPDTGIFFQLTAPDHTDFPIPGEPFSFSVLKQAQALGDLEALAAHGRRVIRVDLGSDVLAGLEQLEGLLERA